MADAQKTQKRRRISPAASWDHPTLYTKLLVRCQKARKESRAGLRTSKLWEDLEPVWVEPEDPASQGGVCKVECVHCGKRFAASCPSNAHKTHFTPGGNTSCTSSAAWENRGEAEDSEESEDEGDMEEVPVAEESLPPGPVYKETPAQRSKTSAVKDELFSGRSSKAAKKSATPSRLRLPSASQPLAVAAVQSLEAVRPASGGAQQAELPQASYAPRPYLRETPLELQRAALLFVETQNFTCHKKGKYHAGRVHSAETEYWWKRLGVVTPIWQQLREVCSKAGMIVLHVVNQSLFANGQDRSVEHKVAGILVPPGSFDAQVLEELQPGQDELVVPKTSTSVFETTNLQSVLANLNIRHLLLAGCFTDQAVQLAVREACSKSYFVTLVTDACASHSEYAHDSAVTSTKECCRQRTHQQVASEIAAIQFSRN